jgi:hypothetical protein
LLIENLLGKKEILLWKECGGKASMTEDQKDQQRISEAIASDSVRDILAKARSRTRANLARTLKASKATVSRIEKRADLYLSTLRSYVEGVGGKLSLIVEFPDRPPVVLAGLGEEKREGKVVKRTNSPAKSKAGSRRAA